MSTRSPLFESLGRRMVKRFAIYSDDEIAIIREFLTRGTAEMREAAAKLP